jgi:8-oxo-dGTP pyrophosphatase MutT (NUDIX family)
MLSLVHAIQEALSQPLPGINAQFRMAKLDRPILSIDEILAKSPRLAAVQILIFPKEETLHFIMIERQEYNGTHSGQMAFPGGKKDPEDFDLMQTALRETQEEIGWKLESHHILGALSPVYIPVSHFLVYPYISFIDEKQAYNQDPREVKQVCEFPLATFLDDSNKKEQTFFYKNTDYTTPAYSIDNKIIWGASAMMLSELEEIIKRVL